jgi:hypothetical protein
VSLSVLASGSEPAIIVELFITFRHVGVWVVAHTGIIYLIDLASRRRAVPQREPGVVVVQAAWAACL